MSKLLILIWRDWTHIFKQMILAKVLPTRMMLSVRLLTRRKLLVLFHVLDDSHTEFCEIYVHLTYPMKRRLMNCVHYSRITSSRKKLLGKDNSVDEVVKIALADEAAAKEVSDVHVCSVNYVKPRTTTAHVSQHQITLSPIIRSGRENLQMWAHSVKYMIVKMWMF